MPPEDLALVPSLLEDDDEKKEEEFSLTVKRNPHHRVHFDDSTVTTQVFERVPDEMVPTVWYTSNEIAVFKQAMIQRQQEYLQQTQQRKWLDSVSGDATTTPKTEVFYSAQRRCNSVVQKQRQQVLDGIQFIGLRLLIVVAFITILSKLTTSMLSTFTLPVANIKGGSVAHRNSLVLHANNTVIDIEELSESFSSFVPRRDSVTESAFNTQTNDKKKIQANDKQRKAHQTKHPTPFQLPFLAELKLEVYAEPALRRILTRLDG